MKSPLSFLTLGVSVLILSACGTTNTGQMQTSREQGAPSKVDAVLEKTLADAQARGDSGQVLTLLAQMHQRDPNDPITATRYARALREDEQINKARLILAPIVKEKGAIPDALTEMAMIHLSLGQHKEAELKARDAITGNAKDGRAWLALGTALDAQGYHPQAEAAFRKGLNAWRGDPAPILNNLALNLASQGHLDEALSVLDKARKAEPGRMEIERNYRIISTLKETAESPAPKPRAKPEEKADAALEKAPASPAFKTTEKGLKPVQPKSAAPQALAPASGNPTND